MTVISTEKNPEQLSLRFVAEFDAAVERVWQLWADPRQLERWWGPPTWPATFERHDFTVGGLSAYYMTGPDGERSRGWWQVTAIDEPDAFEFDDGFADENGARVEEMGVTHARVTLEALGTRTRMVTATQFESLEQLEKMLEMGMEEGMRLALGQMDAILAG